MYLAFNKSIQVETASKFEEKSITNGKALTIHSLGLQSIRMSRIKFSIKNSKFYHLFKELKEKHGRVLNSCVREVAEKGTERADEAVYMTLKDMNEYSRLFLTTKYSDIINILLDMDKFPVDNKHLEILWKHFVNVRMESYNKPVVDIDFTDMIYIPLKFNLYIPVAEEYLMIDECQDLNLAQHKFIDKINSQGTVKKWVACGDRNQCQPLGTKVLMSDFSTKNIEDLQVGDTVISYDIHRTYFTGFGTSHNAVRTKVLETKTSTRVEKIFKVSLLSGHTSSYTLNHKCYVQFNEEKLKGKYAVYLMKKGNKFRVGISPCYSKFKSNAFGPVMRARAEGAESLWILKIFNTREEAYLHEQIISNRFKIPQMMFTLKNNSIMSQENLDIFWYEMKNLTPQANNVLDWFNLSLDYPLWSNTQTSQGGIGNSWKLSSKTMFKTQACNIIPELMDMCIFDKNSMIKDKKNNYKKNLVSIKNIDIETGLATFVSLNIEQNHNYIADGILTSNSIYGFSGAYPESFDLFTKKPNVRELPLDINYRCAVNIVKQSNNVYDIMTPFKSHNGRVATYTLGTVSSSDGLDDNQDNFFKTEFKDKNNFKDILIICRNKRPLFSMYFFLLERNIPAFIMGEDILNGVIRMLKPYGDTPIQTIEDIFEREIEEFEINIKDDKDRAKLFYMKENLANFNIVSRKLCSPFDRGSDLLESFKKLFEDKTNAVTLCSIHKSKGLESEKVIILNESLIPSPFAKKPAQITQEINLKYVARTRAKEELIYLEADFTNF